MSAFIDTKKLIAEIAAKTTITNALKVENWLSKHYTHKPGPELLHDQYSMILTAKCHGCGENKNFNFKVPPLD